MHMGIAMSKVDGAISLQHHSIHNNDVQYDSIVPQICSLCDMLSSKL